MTAVSTVPSPGGAPAVDTTALRVQALTVELGGRAVLQDIDLQLPRGQTLALLGPSGCGKTTLLRSVAGLVATQGGQVQIAGRDVAGLPPQARGIGMMFQSYALFPNLSVRDNIGFGPLAQGWTAERTQARTDELLALIELREHAHKHPAQLSGGQRQRVAMARALAPQPALLLMDEPFSAIDESFRLPLRRSFRALQRALSQSCVLVTHDREEAFELADQVAVMLDGRLARIDTPTGLLRQPGSMAVAKFLGAFNVFEHLPDSVMSAADGPQDPACAWVAPIRSLRLAVGNDSCGSSGSSDSSDSNEQGWRFEAQVVARHAGLRHAHIELRRDDGSLLSLFEDRQPLAVGDRVPLRQPTGDLVALTGR